MKILVTGSAGHLGEALSIRLNQLGHDVVGLDIKASRYTNQLGSICDLEFIKHCMKQIDVVIHTATLHKPHIATHSKQDFIDTNITGTLNLQEAALDAGVKCFIYTSTTSVFGDAMAPPIDKPTAWITEDITPIPKNIYGVTKLAAENLCQLFYRNHQLPCLVLRTSRFFLEEDDNRSVAARYDDTNLKLNEFLYRRVDIEDVVSAHLLAMQKAASVGFDRYIISATTPFNESDTKLLRSEAQAVLEKMYPHYRTEFEQRDWQMFKGLDRVYDNKKARIGLGWQPKYDFSSNLARINSGGKLFSPLAYQIGKKGYHEQVFEDGPYPVE